MAQIYRQYKLQHDYDHIVCWLEWPIQLKVGQKLVLEGGFAVWTVEETYGTIDPERPRRVFRVGGLQ